MHEDIKNRDKTPPTTEATTMSSFDILIEMKTLIYVY
jgi:hypothetical protein